MNILVTGATGFIGKRLVDVLDKSDHRVFALVRKDVATLPSKVVQLKTHGLFSMDEPKLLRDIDVIIHLGGRAHILKDDTTNPLSIFRKVNTQGTIELAQQAATHGVKRFIFVSSIGVNGEFNENAFSETDIPSPNSPYAISKYEAELLLTELSIQTGMEVVIIRPPLVYGIDSPGNFGKLVRLVDKGLPLPLGAIHNKRSLVALDNLVDFIFLCISHPRACNELFLISDDKDLSTTELIQIIANANGHKISLIPVSEKLLAILMKIFRKKSLVNQLLLSLKVDCTKAKELLDWKPVIKMEEQLKRVN